MAAAAWLGWLACALGASWLAAGLLIRVSPRLGLMDRPNHRSLHARPVPRGGGAGFVTMFAALLWPASQSLAIDISPALWRVLFAGFFVAAVGLADDRFGLPASWRLAAQFAAAGVVAAPWIWAGGQEATPGLAPMVLAIFGIVALTNFYNFMDGADGLAAGQGVLTLAGTGWIAVRGGHAGLALVAGLLAATVSGFLIHNWHPARIFMGDAGSTYLGFVFGSLAATAVFEPHYRDVPAAVWLCLLTPFLADTTVTLAGRIWRGERWHQAHRQHYYQRLIGAGWSHGKVARAYLSATALLGVLTVVSIEYGAPIALLLFGAFAVLGVWAGLAWLVPAAGRAGVARANSLPSADLERSFR